MDLAVDCVAKGSTVEGVSSAPLLDVVEQAGDIAEPPVEDAQPKEELPLKALTEISWPPEPDSSIFSDPLKKDDPKPLRREELMRIGRPTYQTTTLTNTLTA